MQNVDQQLLKESWQLFDKNGTGMITSAEVGMFLTFFFFFDTAICATSTVFFLPY